MNEIINKSVLEGFSEIDDNSVNTIITSPPYYGLRDYGDSRQIGLENSPEEYISKLAEVFHLLKNVLRNDGTLWINIADSYSGSGKGAAGYPENAALYKQGTNIGTLDRSTIIKSHTGCKPKDLIGIPWMLAFALRADGWYWRDTVIWSKPNAMPESVKDRTSHAHEYILLFSKNKRYYFDYESIMKDAKPSTIQRISQDVENQSGSARSLKTNGNMKAVIGGRKRYEIQPNDPMFRPNTSREFNYEGQVRKRSVWEVSTSMTKEAHFATFPEKLIVDCIKAGCPEGGIVLDPFFGSGTTGVVARKLNRNFMGYEINKDYIAIAKKRLYKELGMFL